MNVTQTKNPLPLFICAMMICGAEAQDSSTPYIQNTHPDPTISNIAGPIAAMAYNPNGGFLAVAGRDNSIRVYDARPSDRLMAELTHTLTDHAAAIFAIRFNGTNSLVSVSADQTAKTWDIVSGKLLRSVDLNLGKQLIAAITPGNQPLLAGAALKQVRLWNYQTGEKLNDFEANDSEVAALAFTPDGKLLVIGTTKGVVRVMDVASWKVTRTIDLDSPIYSLAASTNHVALGYGDGTVALLNLDGNQDSVPEVNKQTGKINALAFSPNGVRFASASADGTVKVWNTETLKLLSSLEGQSNQVLSVVFSPSGQQVASGGADGRVQCWTVP